VSAVPSPAGALTAARVLAHTRELGGRAYRMRQERAYVLTDSGELADWLVRRGGKPNVPQGADQRLDPGAYRRARDGKIEYDIWIHTIAVDGPSIWEALDASA